VVSNAHSNTLTIIDSSSDTVVNTIKAGTEPRALAYSPDGKFLAVSIIDDDCAAFFKADTLELRQQIAVPQSPQRVIFSPDGLSLFLFVLGKISDTVGVVRNSESSSWLADAIPVTHGPLGATNSWGMAMSSDGKYLYVSNLGENTISVIDLQVMRTTNAYAGGNTPAAMLFVK
jgi:YVTN family beta-propeller protein